MHLGRAQVSTAVAPPVSSVSFSHDASLFAIAGDVGYEVWSTWPLRLLSRRPLPGTLHMALPLVHSPLIALQGGGRSPLYPPNKVVLYHDGLGKAVAELEFGERIRGVISRPRGLLVALRRRTIWFEYGMSNERRAGFWIQKRGEWTTASNEGGLMAVSTAPGTSVLVLPGRQPGHVQLIHLVSPGGPLESDPPSFRSPILLCHTHPLSVLACSPCGSYISTASERGTLIRVWDTARGRLERELRRGMDRVEMWGLAFEEGLGGGADKGGRVLGWSDKGTIHVWTPSDVKPPKGPSSRPQSLQSILTKSLPLPKYFSSETSKAQYHLPRKNPHAFSSVASAATAVPGLRPKQDYSQSNDVDLGDTERFVVCWICAEGTPPEKKTRTTSNASKEDKRRSSRLRFEQQAHLAPNTSGRGITTSSPRPERQIVAITHGGDWYRLRLPDTTAMEAAEDSDVSGGRTECELVEYRRLNVGGGGW